MIGASLYIASCTARNRLRVRLRRLRQPRYLIGAIVGAAYMYFAVFARRRPPRVGRRRGGSPSPAAVGAVLAAAPPVVGTALLGVAAAAWALPFDSGLLEFSDAEVDCLFTAPLSRRQLLVHRLIRSQLGLVFAAIIPIIFYPDLSSFARVRSSIALWLALVTVRLYFTGVTLARRGVTSPAGRLRRLGLAPAVVLFGAAAAVGADLVRAFVRQPAENLREAMARIQQTVATGWAHAAVAPFTALVRPLFATDAIGFFAALAAAAVVCALVCVWVIRMDETFYDVVVDSPARAGAEQRSPAASPTLRRPPWQLSPAGRPELAFAWRAAVDMFRGAGARSVVRPVVVFAGIGTMLTVAARQRGVAELLLVLAVAAAGTTIVLGPQLLRIDLRQDLRNIDLLKTWPLRAADVVRGEIAWPLAVLTVFAWGALAFVFVSSSGLPVRMIVRVSAVAAAAVAAPGLIAAQLAIHNAAALAFPAWVATGSQRPRGLDAMGQRLILLGATLILLGLMMLPAAGAAGLLWFAFQRFLGPPVLVAAAALSTAIVLLEVLVATEALGSLYDKLDYSEIERSET